MEKECETKSSPYFKWWRLECILIFEMKWSHALCILNLRSHWPVVIMNCRCCWNLLYMYVVCIFPIAPNHRMLFVSWREPATPYALSQNFGENHNTQLLHCFYSCVNLLRFNMLVLLKNLHCFLCNVGNNYSVLILVLNPASTVQGILRVYPFRTGGRVEYS
jgi:hypothetical protein